MKKELRRRNCSPTRPVSCKYKTAGGIWTARVVGESHLPDRRELRCPDDGHLLGYVYGDVDGYVETKCQRCKRITIFHLQLEEAK